MWFVGTFVIWLGVPLVTGLVDQSMFNVPQKTFINSIKTLKGEKV